MLIGTALKFFLMVVFFSTDEETVHYFGPFENEEACYQWDYLHKAGVLYVGTCKLMESEKLPVRPT
jgi:hypothetical protein